MTKMLVEIYITDVCYDILYSEFTPPPPPLCRNFLLERNEKIYVTLNNIVDLEHTFIDLQCTHLYF